MPNPSFRDLVHQRVDLLQAGNPLEAFDRFFAKDGMMYANDELFTASAREGYQKQAPFISAAITINGLITDLVIANTAEICAFLQRSNRHEFHSSCFNDLHASAPFRRSP